MHVWYLIGRKFIDYPNRLVNLQFVFNLNVKEPLWKHIFC